VVDEKRAQTMKKSGRLSLFSQERKRKREREKRSCCCVFAFFAVPSPRNRHVRRKERTTKKVAGKPVSPSPGGTLGSGRGPSRCPSFKNSQAEIQSGVPCSASRSNGLSIVLFRVRSSGPKAPNRDLGASRSRTLFPLFCIFPITRIISETQT